MTGPKGRRLTEHRQRVARSVNSDWVTAMQISQVAEVSPRMARAELTHLVGTGEVELRQTWPAFTYRRIAS